jgi:hypothetical protein
VAFKDNPGDLGCPSALLDREFPKPEWIEVRLDIDPKGMPDIVASITDMHIGVVLHGAPLRASQEEPA